MAVNLSPVGGVAAQFFDNNGVILTGGKIYTYTAGTSTPQATYTSSNGATAHSNPIILDASGRVPGGEIWLTDGLSYKFLLKDANDVLIGTYDNITGINSNFINYTGEQEIQTATAGQTVFTLTTMQYQPGTNSLSVFVDGVNQYGPGAQYAYVETSSTVITFVTGLHVGASVKFTSTQINAASYGDAFQISYTPPFTASVATNVGDKLAQTVSVMDFGAAVDGVTDDTTTIQAALNSGASSVALGNGISVVNGTLTIPAGVTLQGSSVVSEYFPSGPGSPNIGSTLLKPITGTNGPIVILQSSSGLSNCYLKHLKTGGATTGIIQIGLTGANSVYNSNITNVNLYGDLTTDITGATTCYGIFYPDGQVTPNTYQRYFNRTSDFYISHCDVAIRLGANCNANNFTGFITRQCYQHILIDGIASNQQCVENTFTGFTCANIGTLPTTATTVFNLKNYALFNVFSGYATEANGAAFSIDSTSNYNIFNGNQNETTASFVPPGGIAGPSAGSLTSIYAAPQSIEQFNNMMLPGLTTGAKYDLGLIGSKQSMIQKISLGNGLPTLDGAGTLVAASSSSRSIIQFNPTVFIKSAQPNFRGRLTLWVSGVGTATHMCSVEFGYIVSNTGTSAGLFEIYEVNLTPSASNFISGLYFISGATGATQMKIAMVGGNLSSAQAGSVVASLDLDVFAPIGYARDTYFQHTFTSTTVTANDVTNAVSMLTVAETPV